LFMISFFSRYNWRIRRKHKVDSGIRN
jgi:hypothetical protein